MTPSSRTWLGVGLVGALLTSAGFIMLNQDGQARGLTASIAMCALGIGAILWPYLPQTERGVTRKPASGKTGVATANAGMAPGKKNKRLHHRVIAWSKMPVMLISKSGKTEKTLLLNISLGGLAVDWKADPIMVGTKIQLDIPGYPTGDAAVVACGRGVLRMRYTGSVAVRERERLRGDCEKGQWTGNMMAR